MITRLLNVALNQFSNMSVFAVQSSRAGRAERDSEYDRAKGEIMRLLRRHCCSSWLLAGFCQWVYLCFNCWQQLVRRCYILLSADFILRYCQTMCSQIQPWCHIRWGNPLRIIKRPPFLLSSITADSKCRLQGLLAVMKRCPIIVHMQRSLLLKQTTYKVEFDKLIKYHLLKCLMTL